MCCRLDQSLLPESFLPYYADFFDYDFFLPMNQRFAFDTSCGFSKNMIFAPKWSLNLLRFVVALPISLAGLVKINPTGSKGTA